MASWLRRSVASLVLLSKSMRQAKHHLKARIGRKRGPKKWRLVIDHASPVVQTSNLEPAALESILAGVALSFRLLFPSLLFRNQTWPSFMAKVFLFGSLFSTRETKSTTIPTRRPNEAALVFCLLLFN